MAASIGTYNYTHGGQNRVVEFFRPDGPDSVYAEVFALATNGNQMLTSRLDGSKIEVEDQCLTSKIRDHTLGRDYKPDTKLSNISKDSQDSIFNNFSPNGRKAIEMQCVPVKGSPFEKVTAMRIYDSN